MSSEKPQPAVGDGFSAIAMGLPRLLSHTQPAVGDGFSAIGSEQDRNGAETLVGVPHPENRRPRESLPHIDVPELDDYDDDKQKAPLPDALPPDEDDGESYPGLVDVGETPEEHYEREANSPVPRRVSTKRPLIDNQTGQPERFHNTDGRREEKQ